MQVSVDTVKAQLNIFQGNYALAKEQSRELDGLLGFESTSIENILFEDQRKQILSLPRQFWYGLDLQSLQTPYSEVVEMISHLDPKPGDLWVDLGAGYGRMGIALGFLRPQVKFIGYEYVAERVIEGNRIFKKWRLDSSSLKQADIAATEFELEDANLYFMYDFGSKEDVFKVLKKLGAIARQKPITVIARGRGVRNWILTDFPWLSQINTPEHFKNWSIFKS